MGQAKAGSDSQDSADLLAPGPLVRYECSVKNPRVPAYITERAHRMHGLAEAEVAALHHQDRG